jgi:hypothetical protein
MMNRYHFKYSRIKEDSALLLQTREVDNRIKVISALDELVAKGVILKYSTEELKEKRKIIDVTYTLYPSHHFISEQKVANKRETDNKLAFFDQSKTCG